MFSKLKKMICKDYHPYLKASHCRDYENLAIEFNTNPDHVYDLAHGAIPEYHEDYRILQKLRELHICS